MNHKKYFDTIEQVSGPLFELRFEGKNLSDKFGHNAPMSSSTQSARCSEGNVCR